MEVVIQELNDLVSYPCQLVSKDGTIYDVPRKSLRRCPFFEGVFNKQPDLQEIFVDISDGSSVIFRDFLKGVKRSCIGDVFRIMEFACKIEWEDFQAYCARAASGIAVPERISSDTIISVVGALVRFLPVRTSMQYAHLVDKCCRKDDRRLRYRLFESVKTILSERKTVAYAPLDIPFFKVEATVALMKNIQGQNITAILHQGKWLSVDLFGSHFCPFEAEVQNFHLSLGQYVVYQTCSGRVLMKDLQSDTPAKVIFETSKFFSSRLSQLHVISKNETTNHEELFEWNDQTREFAMNFSHPGWKFTSAHRNLAGHLIIVLEHGPVIDATTEKQMYVKPGKPYGTGYLDGCTCVVDEHTYEIRLPGGIQLSETKEIDYLGYNTLGTFLVEKGVYETISCRGKDTMVRRDCIGQKSNLHGEVIAVSDLLLI